MSDSGDTVSTEECIQLLMYLPEKINRCIGILAEEYLANTNLKAYYVPYIIHIYKYDGISQKNLKILIPFDKSRISVVVHELIDMELVYNDGSGRNSSLHLTDNGRSCYSICKMFFDIVKKEIFGMDEAVEEEMRKKNLELDKRLDMIIAKHSKS